MRLVRTAAVLAMLGATAAHAQTIDIRDCPLDTVVFVDPWAGGSFVVQKVGTDYSWLCEDGFEPPDAMCSGPFGYLVLEGQYRRDERAEPEQMTAVYTVIKGVPCCDWNVEPGRSSVTGNEDFKWLGASEAPLLREMPFLSIETQYGTDFGNPYYAASCTTRTNAP